MSWNPQVPYNNLPLLPPSDEQESRAVLKATVTAGMPRRTGSTRW